MSTSAPVVPQWDAPFRLDQTTGKVVEVEQGSPQDVAAQIYNVISCPQGAALNQPSFGIPFPLFQSLPLDLNAIVKAVQTLVRDATIEAIQQTLADATSTVNVTVTGTVIAPG